jgi:anti-sigma regulatory factor (Ser/Thr protein kinase)
MTTATEHAHDPDAGTADDGRIVRLMFPAKPEYITLGRLALTEAASNSVRHAYAGGEGSVEIAYELSGDRLAIEVSDEGEGFEHTDEDGADDFENLSEGGLGIAIIRAIADEFELGPGPAGRGSRLRFVKVFSS